MHTAQKHNSDPELRSYPQHGRLYPMREAERSLNVTYILFYCWYGLHVERPRRLVYWEYRNMHAERTGLGDKKITSWKLTYLGERPHSLCKSSDVEVTDPHFPSSHQRNRRQCRKRLRSWIFVQISKDVTVGYRGTSST